MLSKSFGNFPLQLCASGSSKMQDPMQSFKLLRSLVWKLMHCVLAGISTAAVRSRGVNAKLRLLSFLASSL